MTKILISGINGKMGQSLYRVIESSTDATVAGGVDKSKSSLSVPVFTDFEDINIAVDCVIDFSRPETLEGLLNYAVKSSTPAVLATTGYNDAEKAMIEHASKYIPLFVSGNMSLGINLISSLVKRAAATLGAGFDIEIIEEHHNQKVDSPSGTALMLAAAVNEGLSSPLEPVYGRKSRTQRREPNEIGIHSVRGGTVVGEHTVGFFGTDEVIRISHSATSKQVFAVGALKAAQFLVGKSAGMYSMKDLFDN